MCTYCPDAMCTENAIHIFTFSQFLDVLWSEWGTIWGHHINKAYGWKLMMELFMRHICHYGIKKLNVDASIQGHMEGIFRIL